jgi:hypothetical protein
MEAEVDEEDDGDEDDDESNPMDLSPTHTPTI